MDYVEKETVGQSVNKLWHVQRARRVTASNVKAASVTNPCMPSQSLIHVYVIYCYFLEDGDVAMRPMPFRHTEPLLAPVMRTLRLWRVAFSLMR